MARDKPSKASEAAAARKHREDLLDEALAESFPASDPPSIVVSPAIPRKSRSPKHS